MRKRKYLPGTPVFWLGVVLLAVAGCATPARVIPVDGEDALTTVTGIDPADWQKAAQKCIDSLLASGVLSRSDGKASVVMVSRVRNYTLMHLETKILTAKIRQAILQSRQAQVSSAVGVGSNIDLAVRRIRDKEYDDLFNQDTVAKRGTVIAPDMSLSGQIIQEKRKQGRTEESYFMFHVVLTDLETGLALWEDTTELGKQETKSIFD